MSQEWYYSVEGSQQGPVTAAELKKLATDGKLKPEDLVWKDGMPEWKPASTIKGLFGGGGNSTATAPVAKAEDPAPAPKAQPKKSLFEDEDDVRPTGRKNRDADDEEDERPRRRRDEDDEDEDERPRNRRSRDEDEDEDERPRRRRDEDEDDYDRPKKKKKGGRVPADTAHKKMVAGLLGILLGGFGIHKFYLGMPVPGVLIILSNCLFLGGLIGLIEGIIYLTKSDEDFHRDYIVNQKQWF